MTDLAGMMDTAKVTAVFAPASDEDGGHQLGARVGLRRVPIPLHPGSGSLVRAGARVRRAGGERLAEAQTLTELGRAQRAADRPGDARQSWARALSVFEALDDQDQVGEVRAELAAIDARTAS